ncbi:MAG: MFS transporter [Acetobacteraceae bacterium]|nr:MFS transporter [Acetobacteraceae bacterium]
MQVPTDGLPTPQRYWAVLTISLGLVMAVLDGAIANIALPTIAHDLGASPANSIWIVNAYQLAVTISLLPLASLGEIFGYRRVFLTGMVVFTIASLGCAVATSLLTLTVARVFQGFGGAGIMSVNVALLRFIYPRSWIGRGVGINAMVGSVSSALGPTVASVILSVAHWPWLFAVNVPTGALALLAGLRSLPRTTLAKHRFDLQSAALSALTFGLLITGVDGIGHGQRPVSVAIELAAAIGIGGYLVSRQMAQASPLLPVDLMRIPLFALSVATAIAAFAAQGLAYVSLPWFFEDVLGRTQVASGLLMTAWPLTVALIAPTAGRLSDRFPAGVMGGIGLALMAAGLGLLAIMPARPADIDVIWRMCLCGLGFGIFNAPNNRAMITSAPPARSGGASGMMATSRLLGQTLGAALVAMAFGFFPANGTTVTLVMGTGFATVAAAVSLLRMAERPRRA